jgi:hypothetical protein
MSGYDNLSVPYQTMTYGCGLSNYSALRSLEQFFSLKPNCHMRKMQ